MSKSQPLETGSILYPTSQMAFTVAICALAAAGIGAIVNHWLTGWMAIGGMVGVGLFYWAVGVLNLRTESPLFDDDELTSNVSQQTAGADNLYAETVSHLQVDTLNVVDSHKPSEGHNH